MRAFIQKLREIMEISRFQIVGMLMLVFFIIGWTLIRQHVFFKPQKVDFGQAFIDSILADLDARYPQGNWNERSDYNRNFNRQEKTYEKILRPFDPNTMSKEELQAIGISEKVANNIVNYRKTGRKFKSKEDVLKLYAVSESYFYHLEPFIHIQSAEKGLDKQLKSTKEIQINKVNLNTATLEDLTAIKGIGEATANKLIKYRNSLGGFSSMSQIEEVYGLWDKVKPAIYENLMVNEVDIQRRNLKMLSIEELAKHPYLTWNEARAIVNFLKQHPNTSDFSELAQIHILDSEKINKILPYFVLEK